MSRLTVVQSGLALAASLVFAAPVVAQAAGEETAAVAGEDGGQAGGEAADAGGASADAGPAELAASAQDDEALLDRAHNQHDWVIRFEPGVWLVSPSGVVSLPGASSESVRVEDLNLDTPEVRPSGEVHVAADRWRLSFFGSQYDQETEFVSEEGFSLGDAVVAPGESAQVEFDFTVVEVAAGYQIWERDFDEASTNLAETIDADLRLYLIGGVRAYDVGFDVREAGGTGGRSSEEHFFAEPILGLHGEIDLMRDFTVDLQLSGGGYFDSDRSTGSLDIVVGFQWRPHPNVGVQIGWRQVAYWLSDGSGADEFEYNGRMAGIQGGVVIRF